MPTPGNRTIVCFIAVLGFPWFSVDSDYWIDLELLQVLGVWFCLVHSNYTNFFILLLSVMEQVRRSFDFLLIKKRWFLRLGEAGSSAGNISLSQDNDPRARPVGFPFRELVGSFSYLIFLLGAAWHFKLPAYSMKSFLCALTLESVDNTGQLLWRLCSWYKTIMN